MEEYCRERADQMGLTLEPDRYWKIMAVDILYCLSRKCLLALHCYL